MDCDGPWCDFSFQTPAGALKLSTFECDAAWKLMGSGFVLG